MYKVRVLITNASNHSMDYSSTDLPGEPAETRLWNQVLFGVGNGGGDLQNNGSNFPEVLSSRNVNNNEIFNSSPCDYLKKIDNNWDFPSNNYSSNNNYDVTMMEQEPTRLTNWSIAPPSTACNNNISLNPLMPQIKYELPSYVQDHIGATSEPNPLLSGLINSNGGIGYQVGLNNSLIGINNSKFGGLDATWSSNARNLSDLISFGNSLSKPAMEFHATSNRPSIKGPETSSSTKGSGRNSGASDGKKKRSEDSSDTLFKKSKLDSSNTSTIKLQPPKVKLGDKITALQQIVSPFGKTDTASVLLEAINYIRIVQEQVQICPKQPAGHECGYVVMRYMKEIIQDSERVFVSRWSRPSIARCLIAGRSLMRCGLRLSAISKATCKRPCTTLRYLTYFS